MSFVVNFDGVVQAFLRKELCKCACIEIVVEEERLGGGLFIGAILNDK